MSKAKAPPTQILPQEWKNPKVAPAKAPGVVYPETQEEAAIPLVAPAVPDLAPHVYLPVDPAPVDPAPEPEPPPAAPPAVIVPPPMAAR